MRIEDTIRMSLLVVVLLPSPFGRTGGDEGAKLTRAVNPHPALSQGERVSGAYDIRGFGAKGDGKTIDTPRSIRLSRRRRQMVVER